MTNIIRMNNARQMKLLRKEFTWPVWGVKSYLQLIDEGRFIRAEIGEEPSVKYNRVKYNRMNWNEQREYDRKLETMVPEYRLYTDDSVYYPVPKLVHDYYISLRK